MSTSVDSRVLERIHAAGRSNTILPPDSEASTARELIQAMQEMTVHEVDEPSEEFKLPPSQQQFQLPRTVVAPHEKVPHEIMSEIFLHTASPIPLHPCEIIGAPWALRSVCTSWRAVALANHSLWTNLQFTLGTMPHLHREALKRRLDFFNHRILQLSSRQPLSLRVDLHSQSTVLNTETYIIYDAIMRPNLERLIHLDIIMDRLIARQLFSAPSMPMLETLALHFVLNIGSQMPQRAQADPTADVPLFQRQTRLRNLTMDFSKWRGRAVIPQNIPWLQLTALELISGDSAPIDIMTAVHIISQCSNLATCKLAIHTIRGATLPTEITDMPSLFRLHVHVELLDTAIGFISHNPINFLRLPSLTDLCVEHNRYSRPSDTMRDIVSLVDRSGCDLKTLEALPYPGPVLPMALDPTPVEEALLGRFPSLNTLRFSEIFFSEATLLKIEEGSLLPNVQVLHVWSD